MITKWPQNLSAHLEKNISAQIVGERVAETLLSNISVLKNLTKQAKNYAWNHQDNNIGRAHHIDIAHAKMQHLTFCRFSFPRSIIIRQFDFSFRKFSFPRLIFNQVFIPMVNFHYDNIRCLKLYVWIIQKISDVNHVIG